MKNKRLLCIVGPTAAGKTALAVSLARTIGGEVISCDSVQIYRGFDIGSAKPTEAERMGVPHHMIDVAEPTELWSAGRYAREASAAAADILSRGKTPIICGGTGLWLNALTGGLADIPDCPRLDHGGDAYEKLARADPATAARLSPADRQRIFRALDVYAATGRPLSRFFEDAPQRRYDPVCVGIGGGDRAALYARIDARAEAMMDGGLIEETAALLASGVTEDCPPMLSIGYRQAAAVLAGRMGRGEAAEDIKLRTRRYAKRQLTWFRGRTAAIWMDNEKNTDLMKKVMEIFFLS